LQQDLQIVCNTAYICIYISIYTIKNCDVDHVAAAVCISPEI
jgi:hypothetical protein